MLCLLLGATWDPHREPLSSALCTDVSSHWCPLPGQNTPLTLVVAVLMLCVSPERERGKREKGFVSSPDYAKPNETGDRGYKSTLSQCSPKIKALKCSVIRASLKEDFL